MTRDEAKEKLTASMKRLEEISGTSIRDIAEIHQILSYCTVLNMYINTTDEEYAEIKNDLHNEYLSTKKMLADLVTFAEKATEISFPLSNTALNIIETAIGYCNLSRIRLNKAKNRITLVA